MVHKVLYRIDTVRLFTSNSQNAGFASCTRCGDALPFRVSCSRGRVEPSSSRDAPAWLAATPVREVGGCRADRGRGHLRLPHAHRLLGRPAAGDCVRHGGRHPVVARHRRAFRALLGADRRPDGEERNIRSCPRQRRDHQRPAGGPPGAVPQPPADPLWTAPVHGPQRGGGRAARHRTHPAGVRGPACDRCALPGRPERGADRR